MKPTVTWVVLVNARCAKVLENRGPGKGLCVVEDKVWEADPPGRNRDEPGVGHSIAGPGMAAVAQTDPKHKADVIFAKTISQHLLESLTKKEFERLVLVSGPHMLGLMRSAIGAQLEAVLVGEIPKDLSVQPIDAVEKHVGEITAV